MARPYTGKISSRTIERKQKNGDIYVYEEERQYNREKKYTITISSKLIGVKKKGTDKIVSTRAKRCFVNITKTSSSSPTGEVIATRKHVGMMDIIDYMADKSGIDTDLRAITDLPTANKILSLARYLIATDAHSLAGIEEWQYTHKLPYEDGINKGIYHNLFKEIGKDETLQQAFFKTRLDREGECGVYLACDSSTSSTYSVHLSTGIARYGYNKDDDGLPTIKYLVLFSLKTKMPVWFTKLPGNIPDVITIKPIIEELNALGIKKITLVSDNGYYSEQNIGELLRSGYDFITLGSIDVKWIREEYDNLEVNLQNPSYVCPFDIDTNGITISLVREFEWTRKYGSDEKGLKPGDKDKIKRKVYLHFYYNSFRKLNEDREIKEKLLEIKSQLESGILLETMSKSAQKMVDKFCTVVHKKNGQINVLFREVAIEEECKYHGVFVLIAKKEKNCFDCLKWYRRRENIEDFFRRAKQDVQMRHTAVWDATTLHGRMFTQFVALCLYQYIENEIHKVKNELRETKDINGNDKSKVILDNEKKLWNWIDSRSVVRVLNWFDAKDTVDISVKLKSKRWSDPEIKRDRMFLAKLGVIS